MCMMNYRTVNENCCPCGSCPEYLTTCKPIVLNSFIFGECDTCYCEFCDKDCQERSY